MAIVEKKAMKFRESLKIKAKQKAECDVKKDEEMIEKSEKINEASNKNSWKQILGVILSVFVGLLGIAYWQYQQYLDMLELQRLAEEKQRQMEYLRMLKLQQIQQTMANLTSDIQNDANVAVAGGIMLCILVLFVGFCIRKYCCKSKQVGKWQREGSNGRLS
eukprot:147495_1